MYRVLRPFEYLEPNTVDEAVQVLSGYGTRAVVLAGGVDLMSRMRRREIKPEYLIYIGKIAGLDYIENNKTNNLRIGALTTIRSLELSPAIQRDYLPLYEAAHSIASIQVKTMGTVVGNLCVATPASDLASALVALGAKLRIASSTAERVEDIVNFYIGPNRTSLQPGELVTELLLPGLRAGTGGAFIKVMRTADDIAKVNVAVQLEVVEKRFTEVKVAIGSVAPTVIRSRNAEESLEGQKLGPEIVKQAAEAAAEEVQPITDIRSTAEYRKQLVGVLVRQAIEQATERALAKSNTRKIP